LQLYHPEIQVTAASTAASFGAGNTVGAVARRLYDPNGCGEVVDLQGLGYVAAFRRTRKLLASARPIFEAGFTSDGAMAFADVMLPIRRNGTVFWRMVEVKSATETKSYYRDDAAIQAYIARAAGVRLESIAVATVDNAWVYSGDGDYRGLLREEDVTEVSLGREQEVRRWIEEAQAIVNLSAEPQVPTGKHCNDPFPCDFVEHCENQQEPVEYPVTWLPNIRTKALKTYVTERGATQLNEVPDELLNPLQRRVKMQTLSGEVYFDAQGAADALAQYDLPAYFLDFETIGFAVPIWKDTRPYQPLTFQFSVHRIEPDGRLDHRDFLDLSGNDPREALVEALISVCGTSGPIFVYSSFERARIGELATQFPILRFSLDALVHRLVDLRPIAERCYYHPGQQGSWSIKKLLPAITGKKYEELDGVKEGCMAMEAYLEAIQPETSAERKAAIEMQLRVYCALDTKAMVEIWRVFSGRARDFLTRESTFHR
jgi:hypothetical protein